jgi:putative ABC transport system permease protein
MSLALSTVLYEWRRYLAAVVALAFSGLLILAQVGMFMGIGKSVTSSIDRSRGELFVLPPKADSLLNNGGLALRLLPLLYLDPAVVQAADIPEAGGQFSNLGNKEQKVREFVDIKAVDTAAGALTLPTDFDETVRTALSTPYNVAIDKTLFSRLGVKLGETAALDGHAIRVAGVLQNYAAIGNQPTVFVSRQTLLLLGKAGPTNRVGPLTVKITDPQSAELVRDRLNRIGGGQFRVWTKPELAQANEHAFMKQQIIGIMMGFSVLLGAFIGVGITSQTLRGAVLGNIKEFASLRALGVSLGSLTLIVMEQSLWVGLAGLGATAGLVVLITYLAGAVGVPMFFPLEYVVLTGVLLLLIATVSGALTIGVLKKSQPADLLR